MKNGIARVKEFISGETGRKVLIIGGVILLLILLLSSFSVKKRIIPFLSLSKTPTISNGSLKSGFAG